MDYYATDENNIAVLRWLFAENDLHVYETCTGYDREPRGFHSADDAIVALHLSRPERKPGLLLLSLWAPDAGGDWTCVDATWRSPATPGARRSGAGASCHFNSVGSCRTDCSHRTWL